MKRFSFLLTTLMLSLPLIAQPTINSDWIPLGNGAIVSNIEASNVVDPGPSGANVTWDLSGLQTSDTAVHLFFHFADADTTPYASLYPEANIAQVTLGGELYNYFKLTSSKLEYYGLATAEGQLVYSNPKTMIEFPFTYQSTFTDEAEGQFEIAGITAFLNESSDVTADSWGTLILPQTTFNNVLRLHGVEQSRDSIDLGIGLMSVNVLETETYAWFSPDYPNILASYILNSGYSISYFTGLPPDTTQLKETGSYSFDAAAVLSSSRSVDLVESISIAPNPAVSIIRVHIEHGETERFNLKIVDALGREIYKEEIRVVQGENLYEVPAPKQGGIYFLLLEHPRGTQTVRFSAVGH